MQTLTYKEWQTYASIAPLSVLQQMQIFVFKRAKITDYYPKFWQDKAKIDFFLKNPNNVKNPPTNLLNPLDTFFQNIKDFFNDLGNGIKNFFQSILDFFKSLSSYRYFVLIAVIFVAVMLLKKR